MNGTRQQLQEAIRDAQIKENAGDATKSAYVLWSNIEGEYIVVSTMPHFGEWYTTDGIQRGV